MWKLILLLFNITLMNVVNSKKYREYDSALPTNRRNITSLELPSSVEIPIPISDVGLTVASEYENDKIKQDYHVYYNSTFYYKASALAKTFWIDLDNMEQEHVITNELLSDSHRQALTVELSFEFPFYGSGVHNITIATGGFVYMGEYLHNWIAATQYVAPLMANFDTSLSKSSTIKYADNGTFFTVQWDKVYVKEDIKAGPFTFQVTLFENGDICFAYKEIPISISKISGEMHPVRVGLSDAYILERAVYFLRRKTIYEYHRIDMKDNVIANNTAIFFKALPTCLSFNDCKSCMDSDESLECSWCNTVQRCSDGIDRKRQSWISNDCTNPENRFCSENGTLDFANKTAYHRTTKMSSSATSSTAKMTTFLYSPTQNSSQSNYYSENTNFYTTEVFNNSHYALAQAYENVSFGGLEIVIPVAILTLVLLVCGVWIFYAYKFPESQSGQLLIKYRPSQWKFRSESSPRNDFSYHL